MGFCNIWRALFLTTVTVCVIVVAAVALSGLARHVRRTLYFEPDMHSFLDAMATSKDDVMDKLATAASFLKASVVPVSDCWLAACTVDSFVPSPLTAVYSTFHSTSNVLQGLGVMTVLNADIQGNITDDDLSNKISFEVTSGSIVQPPCPSLLFGYTDSTNTYNSYCIDEESAIVDFAGGAKYTGPDYGLTPEERLLYLGQLQGYNAMITPVFDLVGLASISLETAHRCLYTSKAAYALTFAQTNLLLLSDQFDREFTDNLGPSGVAFTVDSATTGMLAASTPGQVVNETQTAWGSVAQIQLSPYNATRTLIVQTAQFLESVFSNATWAPALLAELKASDNFTRVWSTDKLQVSARIYNYVNYRDMAPQNWIDIVAVDKADFTSHTRGRVLDYAARIAVTVIGLVAILGCAFYSVYREYRSDINRGRSEVAANLERL